jgi:hypothetical protein
VLPCPWQDYPYPPTKTSVELCTVRLINLRTGHSAALSATIVATIVAQGIVFRLLVEGIKWVRT